KQPAAMEEFFAALRAPTGSESLLEPRRFEIAGEGPTRCPAAAPTTPVEFSDYQCPYCKRAGKVVAEVPGRSAAQARRGCRRVPPRSEVAGEGPPRGPPDAPITLVEFSDYQCPYCKSAEKIVAEVLDRYPTQVRLVYRHFPLDNIHPQARGAAEAAACAEEQG